MEIISKRHPYKFYLALILTTLLFLIIGGIFIYASIRDNNKTGYYIFIGVMILITYTNYVMIVKSPKIILNNKGIYYKNKFYVWDDIVEIRLTGKSRVLLNFPMECATLNLKELKTLRIFDDMYSNSAELKYFIQKLVIDKKDFFEFKEIKNITVGSENEFFIPYKGSPIFSFRGIVMWGLIGFIVWLCLFGGRNLPVAAYLIMPGVCVVWFVLNSTMMYYFEVSKNFFTIRNHYFFWVRKVYSINDISEIVYETQPKQSNKLRLITKDFKSKIFAAGSLSDKTWLEMKTELESKNIVVRNECI